jgi:hypothetical protein
LFGIDHYEERKLVVTGQRSGGRYGNKTHRSSLLLTRQAREELLLEWGTSFHDIIDAIRTNVKVKNQRRRTVNAIGTYDRWEEVMENASRKIKRTLLLKNKTSNAAQAPTTLSQQQQYLPQKKIVNANQNSKKSEEKNGLRKGSPSGQQTPSSTRITQNQHQSNIDSPSGSCNSKNSNGSSSVMQNQVQLQSIDRFSAHSGTSPTNQSQNRRNSHNNNNPIGGVIDVPNLHRHNIITNDKNANDTTINAPVTVIHVSSNQNHESNPKLDQEEQHETYNQLQLQQHQLFANNFGPVNTYNQYNDDVDEDITIGSHDFISAVVNNETNHFYMRALQDPHFVNTLDDQGEYDEDGMLIIGENTNFIDDDIDGLTSYTPMSEFTYPMEDDDDDENDDDEFEELDRDSSYWEIRNSGQNYAAISRKVHPVVISESDDIVLDNGWTITSYNKD